MLAAASVIALRRQGIRHCGVGQGGAGVRVQLGFNVLRFRKSCVSVARLLRECGCKIQGPCSMLIGPPNKLTICFFLMVSFRVLFRAPERGKGVVV